jgi:hypothetical protein
MGAASKAARLALKKQRKKKSTGATAAKRRAAAKLAEEKAAAEAAAALKAQEEEAASLFSELALWRLEARGVVGKVGMDIKQTPPPNQHPELRRATVHHVTNPALQTAYERKKEELAARLGGAANVNERFLFHGTSLANAKAITTDNFCLSKVKTPSRCRCHVFVVIESLFFYYFNTPAGEDTFG